MEDFHQLKYRTTLLKKVVLKSAINTLGHHTLQKKMAIKSKQKYSKSKTQMGF